MRKHCIFEHFLRFVKQIQPKLWVIVTLQLNFVYSENRFLGIAALWACSVTRTHTLGHFWTSRLKGYAKTLHI